MIIRMIFPVHQGRMRGVMVQRMEMESPWIGQIDERRNE